VNKVWIAALAVLPSSMPAMGATITVAEEGPGAVHVIGQINFEDGGRFSQLTQTLSIGTYVVLNSPGGNAVAGLEIGRIIRARGFIPVALRKCLSACATAWLGGKVRHADNWGAVGFHNVYDASRDDTPSGVGNALLGAYLRDLGLSDAAIEFMTAKGATGMAYLNTETAARLGIKVGGVPADLRPYLPTEVAAPQPSYTPQPYTLPQPYALPRPMPVLALPACESAVVKNELTKVGNRRGVAVFNIFSATLVSAGDMEVCSALASTSAGRLAVTYTVAWANRQAGVIWVEVRSYRRTW
jgi:hypothetical protein